MTGVYNDGRPEPVITGGPAPTCPFCGTHGQASPIQHPHGRWYCSCGSIYWGTDSEWQKLAQHRREAVERRSGNKPPVEPAPRTIERKP